MIKPLLFLLLFLFNVEIQAQITFRACTGSLGAQDYTLNSAGTVGDRNTYNSGATATSCGAGACDVQIIWTGAQWEIQLSQDAGATYPNTLYINTTAATPNPPSASLGTWVEQTGCSGGIVTLSGDVQNTTTLPIELRYFEASLENQAVQLRWMTDTEQDNAYFEIERSSDALYWESIAELDGAGNSTSPISYAYTDAYAPYGWLYYRLKQTDFDGSFSYSNTQVLKRAEKAGVQLYPNPSRDLLYLTNINLGSQKWYLSNALGQIQSAVPLRHGHQEQSSLDISALSTGWYQLHTEQESFRFYKQ